MDHKFKTKENTIQKHYHNNHLQYHMQNIPRAEKKEAEQDSASYHTYASDQLKSNVEKSFQGAKNYAVKNIRSSNRKKKNLAQGDCNTQQATLSSGTNRSRLGSKIKTSKTHIASSSVHTGTKSTAVHTTQKNQAVSQAKNTSKTLIKIADKVMDGLKKAIPLQWKAYIALIGGGIIITLGFLVVLFGSIFGGEDGTTYAGAFAMPFDNAQYVSVTDDYGLRIHPITGEEAFHYGIDFGTPWHCEIKSVAIGEVVYAADYGTYGNTVIIKHDIYGDVIYSMYAHLSEIRVEAGQMLMQGEVIGLEGGDPQLDPNPGSSTGHHLHFSMMDGEMVFVNPNDYLMIKK